MQDSQLLTISNFIWNVADSVLRDVFQRGKYRDVILPMTVIRRLDGVLEPTKQKVLEEKKWLDEEGIADQRGPLQQAAGQQFFNASPFTLRELRNIANRQQLRANFEAYLDGFSPNVQDILEKFEFRNQVARLSNSGALDALIERFLSPTVNLSPNPVLNDDGEVRLPGLDNHAMGTIFEDLIRRFNEDNNDEAGEHWTPRDAVELMAKLVFLPIEEQIQPTTYLLYDGALGTGGMLTVAEQTLQGIAEKRGEKVSTHLYGQEINSETYAICKADLLLKGEENADANIIGGPEHSTLSNDAFKGRQFDFMLSNPPYGKSWSTDLDKMGGKKRMTDPRFVIQHGGAPEYSLITRSSDGQLMFLANMLSKMKEDTLLGSRIAEVHNGSSLFTGDAGQGESNIRRWIIENDWLEAIVALPLNMFYNTGIATYVWVLTNRKVEHRKGYVQLIDATGWHTPLRRNLGSKNCELSPDDITPHLRRLPGLRGNRAIKDIPQPGLRLLEGHRGAPAAAGGNRPGKGLHRQGNPGTAGHRATLGIRAPGHQENPRAATRSPPRSTACSPPLSRASPPWSSTSPTPNCATLSKSSCSTKAASKPSCAARCCPTPPTPGTSPPASKSATKSVSPATSTGPSPCARWRRYALI